MALQAQQLLQKTPRGTVLRSQACTVRRLGKVTTVTDKKRGVMSHAIYSVRGTDTYRVTIDLYPKAKGKMPEIVPSAPAWVSCTCAFFLYRCEFALARVGSSSIVHSNGQPARHTNPRNIPYVCKHVYRALKHLLATKGK